MSRLKHAVSGGGAMSAHHRDRRKSYYHGKYNRELTTIISVLAIGLFVLSLQM